MVVLLVWYLPQRKRYEYMKKWLFLGLLTLFFIDAHAVKVVFRLDDPRLETDSISMGIVKLFNEKKVPLSIAVVPCDNEEQPILPTSKDSLYISELQTENIEIVLHGLTHQDLNNCGEFGGLDYAEAARRIEKGKTILQSVFQKEITSFVPPFNSYNNNTENALIDNGFSVLSADMYGIVHSDKMHYMPETLGHLMTAKGIWRAAREAILDCKESNAVCIVMFHAYDLPNEKSWLELKQLLEDCVESSKVELYTFQSLYKNDNSSTIFRYCANQLESGLQKLLLPKGVLYPTWLCVIIHILNALCYSILPLIIMIFMLSSNCTRQYRKIILSLFCSASVFVFIIAYWHLLGPLKLLVLNIGISLILPIIIKFISKLFNKD